MERRILSKLIKWKNQSKRKPLLLEGARQVGKTWIAKEFGKRFFKNTIYINFDQEKRLSELFHSTLIPIDIIAAIGALKGVKINPQDTLIIFDEVQEEPRALSSLKYFCEDAPEYNIIATGSFMGIALHKGTSFPVGKVYRENIYPLSFVEYLEAKGLNELVERIEQRDIEFITSVKTTIIKYLKEYYVIGGMPEIVENFIENNDYNEARAIQTTILDLYQQDFSKHADRALVTRLNQVWSSIPSQLSKENRKFQYGNIQKGARAKDFELAIQWLNDCGLIHKCHRITTPKIPLKAYYEMSTFKIFLNDVGLLGAMSNVPVHTIISGNAIFSEFKGALTEQYVLQQLITEKGICPFYYSTNDSRCEIDFIIQDDESIIPIEVKAEENLKAKSLKVFCEKFSLKGTRVSMSDYRKQEWMTNYPLYAFAQWI